MINLYFAEYVEFNFVFVYIFICFGLGCSLYIFRKKKPPFNRKKISLVISFSLLFFCLISSSNKGFYTNKILREPRVLYEGEISKVEYGSGFEVVKISGVFLPRSKYKYSGYPDQCWKGDFEKILITGETQLFKIEVYWIKGELRNLEYSKKYTDDFPCILKVDMLKS